MAVNPLVDSRDLRFVLFEMLEAEKLTQYEKFSDFDKDTFEATLELAEQIAVEQIYPINAEGDKEGVKFDPKTKKVTIPESFKPAMSVFCEAGFPGLATAPEFGGMGMPFSIFSATSETFIAGSVAWYMFVQLSVGAMNLVRNYYQGRDRDIILEKMITGKWGGTMCLTEPDAGSDVGALKTRAIRQDDGSYLISGQKIFISSGDNDMYENIIHPVLARIEGDPAGTKGISIFLVPKYLINEDGSLGGLNDVECSGIEHKMGIHASPTCTLNFGDNGKCVGYLMGDECKGMRIMFQMMNEARLQCSIQGLAVSSTAYLHAVTYAKNRKQMPHVMRTQDPDAPSVPIIQHPDVKRMLLLMKANVEAMRMITYFTGYNIDIAEVEEGEAAREAQALVDFLIPICKAGNTDLSWQVTSEAIQVYGGYGYCSDYPVEQFARDSKILSLYEGTNGIQSIDLLTRKLLMNREQYMYNVFKKRIQKTIEDAKGIVDYKYISPLVRGIDKMDELIDFMMRQLASGRMLRLFISATPLRQAMVMLAHAWMHLWALTIAIQKMHALVGERRGEEREKFIDGNYEAAYYSGRVLSAQYYIGAIFQNYFGKVDSILSEETAIIKSSEAIFTGAPEE